MHAVVWMQERGRHYACEVGHLLKNWTTRQTVATTPGSVDLGDAKVDGNKPGSKALITTDSMVGSARVEHLDED